MDCPHCRLPLLSGTCPKCKYDPTLPRGGELHLKWLEDNGEALPEYAQSDRMTTTLRRGKNGAVLTVLTWENLAENCSAQARKDVFWSGMIMVTVSLWITIMALPDLTKGKFFQPQVLFMWVLSAGLILYAELTRGRTARKLKEVIPLGQFRLIRTVVRYGGKGRREYTLNGEDRDLPRKTVGAVNVWGDEECILLMIDGEPNAVFPSSRYLLGSDLEGKLGSGSL